MEISGGAEALKNEILRAAGRESAGLLAEAAARAEEITASAERAAAKNREGLIEAALKEGARRREMLLSSLPLEASRLRAARLEELLDSIKEDSLAVLPAEAVLAGMPAVLAGLAARAIAEMEGSSFTLFLAPEDMPSAAGLAAEIERRCGRAGLELTLRAEPGLAGGVIVSGAGGRQRWDNSFRARLERLWPALRGRLLPGTAGAGGGG